MINSKLLRKKQLKLKTILPLKSYEHNIYRSNFFYNFHKYRKRKWSKQRNAYSNIAIFERYAPNLTYLPEYSFYINIGSYIPRTINVKINKFDQLLNYKSRCLLRSRLSGFFWLRKRKDLKKFLVYRHINLHFNVFDSNYEVFLLRLGILDSIKEIRFYLKQGILKVNNHIVTQTRHFMHLDIIKFSKNFINFYNVNYFYDYKLKRYICNKVYQSLSFFNYIRFYIIDYLEYEVDFDDEEDYEFDHKYTIEILEKHEKNKFLGILPFTSVCNFENFSFIYFSTLLKNQWHFFWDFFIMKKFLQYNR